MTYEQIADDYGLWIEYVDPDGAMTKGEFDALTIEQKVQIQVDAFGEQA